MRQLVELGVRSPDNRSHASEFRPDQNRTRVTVPCMSADSPEPEPVIVIEAIPVAGEHGVTPEEIQREGIPTPPELQIFPELGRGVAGRIHPALDRNLLRRVALKRLSKELARQPFYRDGFIAEAHFARSLIGP